jgi:hypothetical protein
MITFDVKANTTGWVGFGFGKTDNYQGVNHFIAYTDTYNRVHIGEYYSQSGTYAPTSVRRLGGNFTLANAGGYNRDNQMNFRFSRKFDTGSSYSVPFTPGAYVPMIFTWRETGDPSTEGNQLYPETKRSNVRIMLYPTSFNNRYRTRGRGRQPVVLHPRVRGGPNMPLRGRGTGPSRGPLRNIPSNYRRPIDQPQRMEMPTGGMAHNK